MNTQWLRQHPKAAGATAAGMGLLAWVLLRARGYLYIGGERVKVPFKTRHDLPLKCGSGSSRRRTPPTFIVLHDSVTWNTEGTHAVLTKRGYSTHFSIAWDGTVFQHLDPATCRAWHISDHNRGSIGVDFTNPADPNYQSHPKNKHWHKLVTVKIHGKTLQRLAATPAQISSGSSLIRVLARHFGFKPTASRDSRVTSNTSSRTVFSHSQLAANKTDGQAELVRLLQRNAIQQA